MYLTHPGPSVPCTPPPPAFLLRSHPILQKPFCLFYPYSSSSTIATHTALYPSNLLRSSPPLLQICKSVAARLSAASRSVSQYESKEKRGERLGESVQPSGLRATLRPLAANDSDTLPCHQPIARQRKLSNTRAPERTRHCTDEDKPTLLRCRPEAPQSESEQRPGRCFAKTDGPEGFLAPSPQPPHRQSSSLAIVSSLTEFDLVISWVPALAGLGLSGQPRPRPSFPPQGTTKNRLRC
ncbi:hypothetical protein GQ53DRAFT_742360 [Thozetella sp. PMI_491]|nr:hypothetical protein GQ53DRAFT_742360 [Thozetella sp. PMI_491]